MQGLLLLNLYLCKMNKYLIFCTLYLSSWFCQAQTKNQTDTKGLKQGYWEKIDTETGKIAYKGSFKDSKPQGVFYYYYKGMDSIRSKSEFRQDGKIAYVTMYHLTTGKVQAKGKYIAEEKDSLWSFYDAKGVLLSTETYTKGKKDGISKVYYENGNLSEEKMYKNNLLEGPFKLYYDDKKIKAQGAYMADQYDGKCSWLYPNGIAAAEGFYEKGVKKGIWVYKMQNAKITDREVWQNGKMLNKKEMDAYFKSKGITLTEDTKADTKQPQQKTTSPKTNNTRHQEEHE